MLPVTIVAVFTSLSFFAYGASCLFTEWMGNEFERYGLARFRILTGLLEIFGAIGILIGLAVPIIGFLAAAGLTMVMLGAFGVRLRIRDGLLQTLPSVFYLIITLYLAYLFFDVQ